MKKFSSVLTAALLFVPAIRAQAQDTLISTGFFEILAPDGHQACLRDVDNPQSPFSSDLHIWGQLAGGAHVTLPAGVNRLLVEAHRKTKDDTECAELITRLQKSAVNYYGFIPYDLVKPEGSETLFIDLKGEGLGTLRFEVILRR